MDKLKKFAPILMFVAVLGLCGAFVNWYYEVPKEVLAEKRYETNLVTVEKRLTARTVDPAYAYSPERAGELKKLTEQADANMIRPSRTLDDKIGVFVAYPMPSRPRSDAIVADKLPVDVIASLKALSKVEAKVDQGAIFISFNIPEPKENILMDLVRVEVFRGTEAKKIDMTKPYGTVELGPEEPVAAPTGPAVPVAPAAPAERVRGGTPPASGGKKAPPIAVPKYTRAFRDSFVDQKTEYFYKLRLIGRFTSTEDKFEPNRKADGSIMPGPGFKHHVPNDKSYTAVTPKNAGSPALLYALPPTEEVHGTTPSNFTIRLEGIVGTPPPPGRPRDPANPLIRDYGAKFEIRAWLTDLQAWQNHHIEVKEGDPLTGKLNYKTKDGEKKEYDYTNELGYKFDQIVFEDDPNSKIKGAQVEVALLDNVKTKQKEKFFKMSNPKAREASLLVLDAIWKEQEEARKKDLEMKKAFIEKNKSDAGTRGTTK